MPLPSSSVASAARKNHTWEDSESSDGEEEQEIFLPKSSRSAITKSSRARRRSIAEDSSSRSDESSSPSGGRFYQSPSRRGPSLLRKEKQVLLDRQPLSVDDDSDSDSNDSADTADTAELVRRLKASKSTPRIGAHQPATAGFPDYNGVQDEPSVGPLVGTSYISTAETALPTNYYNDEPSKRTTQSPVKDTTTRTTRTTSLHVASPTFSLQSSSNDDDDDDDGDDSSSVDTIELAQRLMARKAMEDASDQEDNHDNNNNNNNNKSNYPKKQVQQKRNVEAAESRSDDSTNCCSQNNEEDGENQCHFVLPPQSDSSSSSSESDMEDEAGTSQLEGVNSNKFTLSKTTQLRETTTFSKPKQFDKSPFSADTIPRNNGPNSYSTLKRASVPTNASKHLPLAAISSNKQPTLPKPALNSTISQRTIHSYLSNTATGRQPSHMHAARHNLNAECQREPQYNLTAAARPIQANIPSSERYKGNGQETEIQSLTHEDLYEAAFASPVNKSPSVMTTRSTTDITLDRRLPNENDLFEAAFDADDHQSITKYYNDTTDSVVNLCFDDSEEDDPGHTIKQTAAATAAHYGLRAPPKSPRFNVAARGFAKPHPFFQTKNPAIDIESDIEVFSDDETDHSRRRKARRVTEDHSLRMQERCSTDTRTGGRHSLDSPATNPLLEPSKSWTLKRPWPSNTRRRLRDATASNPAFAASVRSNRTTETSENDKFEHAGSSLWYKRHGASSDKASTSQISRNDLSGGSGVGVGSFTFAEGGSSETIDGSGDIPGSAKPSGSRRARSKRGTSSKPKQRRWGSQRRKGKSANGKRTRRGAYQKAGGRRAANGWNNEGVWGSSQMSARSFAGEDPALRNVGGAEISF